LPDSNLQSSFLFDLIYLRPFSQPSQQHPAGHLSLGKFISYRALKQLFTKNIMEPGGGAAAHRESHDSIHARLKTGPFLIPPVKSATLQHGISNVPHREWELLR
jgi:hypothetical protein